MMIGIRQKALLPFLLPYTILLILGFYPAFFMDKLQLHMVINEFNHPKADLFFKYITHLGDGIGLVIIAFLFLFINFRASLYVALSGIVSGLFTQLLKRMVFNDFNRPASYFQHGDLHSIQGVSELFHHSFPSGHATASFALFLSLSFIMAKPNWSGLLLIIAVLAAFSRVYLSHHFFQDIYVGSAIGSITAMLMFVVFYRKYQTSVSLNRSLLTLK